MSTKGEAVSLAITEIAAEWFQESEHGIVARVKRNIMDRDVYEKAWGKGPMAVAKHQLKEAKQLDVSKSFSLSASLSSMHYSDTDLGLEIRSTDRAGFRALLRVLRGL